ncbi:ornithine-oxo-acid transaminase [Thecamonas trahens ATCC 50062]|uniref:ornithine aminotransferase n=1 Tax=Thecamonas trahens ATCC 50062 TaxID=461836 RepID=A0A0L0DGS2_THETB|nr:ornithine-oxo-acid transaminase [Thecamonas trahens ATCC 50062]KNC51316.1 ornithine-oxo-acid transaminase [Thecamonas trahens ATCC 50062]|eukprot:XP_013756238.1 ornithine-oxo-acid transaminase [Thecamonas trahens ATCC 50062]
MFRLTSFTLPHTVRGAAAALAARAASTQTASAAGSSKAKPQVATAEPVTDLSSEEAIALDNEYGAHNYSPLDVVFSRAKGLNVWDPEGNHYYDFLSAYSALNQGHLHPKLVAAAINQTQTLSLSSRAFYNDIFPAFAEKICQTFDYEAVLPMNTGAEAVESALKIARKWATDVKGVPSGSVQIISACGCFHGRTLGAISMSCDPDATEGFHPLVPGQLKVDFGDLAGLEATLAEHGESVGALLLEPIQGEAGVVVPPDGYLAAARALCDKHNVLFIADEIQTGIARTGRMLAVDHDNVRPDIVLLGKALGGGIYPISAVLADRDVMDVITPGTHGSTFGGNPLGAAVAIAALDVVAEENLAATAQAKGEAFRARFAALRSPLIKTVRGKGLLNAFVMDTEALQGASATDLCHMLKDEGVLCKPTHGHIIRLAPPLTITDEEMDDVCERVETTLARLEAEIAAGKHPVPQADPDAPPPRACERCGRADGW